MIFMNGNLLIPPCTLQSSIALPSAESEPYGICSGIAGLLPVGSLLRFLVGEDIQMTAARGIMQKTAQRKLKHIHIRNLGRSFVCGHIDRLLQGQEHGDGSIDASDSLPHLRDQAPAGAAEIFTKCV